MSLQFKNTDEVLRVLSHYHSPCDTAVLSVDASQPTISAFHDHEVYAHIRSPTGLGQLAVLSVETLQQMLRYCPLQTAMLLRQLSRSAKALVDTSIPYKHLASTSRNLLATLLHAGVGDYFTLHDVWCALLSSKCFVCGQFGAFMYMPECARCCVRCLNGSPRLMPMYWTDVKAIFGLAEEQLKAAGVPTILSLPGERSLPGDKKKWRHYTKRFELVDEEQARKAAIAVHGSEEALLAHIQSLSSAVAIAYRRQHEPVRRAPSGRAMGMHIPKPIRTRRAPYLVATHLPFMRPTSPALTIERGISCRGCEVAVMTANRSMSQNETLLPLLMLRVQPYTVADFLEHVQTCPSARSLWDARSDASKVSN